MEVEESAIPTVFWKPGEELSTGDVELLFTKKKVDQWCTYSEEKRIELIKKLIEKESKKTIPKIAHRERFEEL